jgi:Ca2+-transporting ATPase
MLELSDRVLSPEGEAEIDDASRTRLLTTNDELASRGLRVLGMATGEVSATTEEALGGLTFVGFVGIVDPPAPHVKETISRFHGAGIRTVMLTGDQRLTAAAIARQLGLLERDDEVVDGRELEGLSETDLRARLVEARALSRVSPADKLRVVDAYQASGDIVAMLGDGVNDAPALKTADVGVAMGRRGTDVAKESASVVLQDDRFETIAAAIEEGRVIFANIRKFVFYLFSCNLAEVLVLFAAGVAGLPIPLLPLQILWLNLVTDTFPALALAFEPAEPDIMRRPPHDPKAALLSAAMLRAIGFYAALITAATLAGFVWALSSPERAGKAVTMSFLTLALAQILHLGNARSAGSVLAWRAVVRNPYALGAVALTLALQGMALHVPALARVLGTQPLSLHEWMVAFALGLVPALIGQGIRLWRQRVRPTYPTAL